VDCDIPWFTFSIISATFLVEAMHYLLTDGNLLGRYAPSLFKAYPAFEAIQCTRVASLRETLAGLRNPRVVIITSISSMLAASGSLEPPSSRAAALSVNITQIRTELTTFSDQNEDVQVSLR
jgi:hypothetical protein